MSDEPYHPSFVKYEGEWVEERDVAKREAAKKEAEKSQKKPEKTVA